MTGLSKCYVSIESTYFFDAQSSDMISYSGAERPRVVISFSYGCRYKHRYRRRKTLETLPDIALGAFQRRDRDEV